MNITDLQAGSTCSPQFPLQLTSSQLGNLIQKPAFHIIGFGSIVVLVVLLFLVNGAIARSVR